MANTRRVLSRMQTNAAKKQSEGSIDSSFEAFQTMFKKLLLSNCPSKYKSAKSKISVEFDDVAYDETTAGFQVNVYFPDNTYMTDYFKFKYTDSKSSIEDEISRFWAYVRPVADKMPGSYNSSKLDTTGMKTNAAAGAAVPASTKLVAGRAHQSSITASKLNASEAEESFFVSCNEDTLVLKVYKESGKWQEQALLDEKGIFAPARYMGYLTKADIKSWLIQDYQDVRTITEAEAAELAAAEPTDEEVVKDKFWFLGKTHAGKAALSNAYGSFEWLATVAGPSGYWEYSYPESSSKEEVLAALGVDCEDSFKEVSDYEANDAENAIIKARRKTNSSRHVSLKASRDVQKLNPAGPIKINASLDDGGLEKAFTSLSPEVQPVQGILITVPEEADGVIEPGVYMAFYDATEGCYVLAEPSMSEETCIGYASIDELTNACFGYPTSTAPMSILDEEVLV